MAGTASSGLSPQQVDSAYGISSVSFSGVTGNGSGQTIAIVNAYNDSNIASDLAAFDKSYGLSAPPSFTVDNLGTSTTNSGWAVETALDVEWAHAVAPEANIVLVEAPECFDQRADECRHRGQPAPRCERRLDELGDERIFRRME